VFVKKEVNVRLHVVVVVIVIVIIIIIIIIRLKSLESLFLQASFSVDVV